MNKLHRSRYINVVVSMMMAFLMLAAMGTTHEPIKLLTRYAWNVSFLFSILDHVCTTCFVFANPFVNPFQRSFANSQR